MQYAVGYRCVTRNVIETIDAGTLRANRLKFSPDGRSALISDMEGGGLVVIDTQSRRVLNRLPVGRMPEGILITPDGTRACRRSHNRELKEC